MFSGAEGRPKTNERQESGQLQKRTPVHVSITTKRDRLPHEMLMLDTHTCGGASSQAVCFPDGTEAFGASSSSPTHGPANLLPGAITHVREEQPSAVTTG